MDQAITVRLLVVGDDNVGKTVRDPRCDAQFHSFSQSNRTQPLTSLSWDKTTDSSSSPLWCFFSFHWQDDGRLCSVSASSK